MTRACVVLLMLNAMLGCATAPDSERLSAGSLPEPPTAPPPQASPTLADLEPLTLEDRMVLANLKEQPSESEDRRYSFRAKNMPLVDALALFARANRLNIVVSVNVGLDEDDSADEEAIATVDFRDLRLKQAMAAFLDPHDYHWVWDDDLIHVRRMKTKTFTLDYIRLVRSGNTRSLAQVTAGSDSGSEGMDAGSITVEQDDQVKFWEELEEQVNVLLSEEGRLVMNRLSGTIQVTDSHQRLKDVTSFLMDVRRALTRQVAIEAKIYEVALNDDYSLGIDWSRVDFLGDSGTLGVSNIIATPFGGFLAKAATTNIGFRDGSFDGVLAALREQGSLKVVSQPRIVTMNNQPALIKVATDQSFFVQTIVQGTAGSGNIITEEIQSVTSGLVLSVTPQISDDGWIMLDVSPIITRLTNIVTSQLGSTAPVLDVKQSSSLVRMRDGEMVVIGGLIQDQVSKTERKVPWLGDIPWLGRLFKGTYETTAKTELVIFLSPRIIS